MLLPLNDVPSETKTGKRFTWSRYQSLVTPSSTSELGQLTFRKKPMDRRSSSNEDIPIRAGKPATVPDSVLE